MDNDAFVQKVKMLCLEKGLKPTNVCNECGVGGSFLPDIKRGRSPSVDKVQMLAAYLGVTTSELLGEEKESAPAAEGGPRYPPEYDQLSPEDRMLVDSMIRRLIMEKNQRDTSSPSNGAGGETA
ncbi:MAG: helix-turn-helix transcriptional regulator [Lachnospiraceae bacterium]|nr:helix-turn-helix transcriptional regulator [Lachnospiraceae bacterium]